MMIKLLRQYGLTIVMTLVCLGLAIWTWLAYQDFAFVLKSITN
jgi:hypothetical protein